MAACICPEKALACEQFNRGGNALRRPVGGWICPEHGQIDYADTVIIKAPRIRRPPKDDHLIQYKACPKCEIEREDDKDGNFFCPSCGFYF